MPASEDSQTLLRDLLRGQPLAVLATQQAGRPYASLVAFAAAEDMRSLLFVTRRDSAKYRNLVAEPRVALLVDNRSPSAPDFAARAAVTAAGRAGEVTGPPRSALLEAFVERHPQLDGFARAPSTALFRVDVETYYLVTRFERVEEMDVRRWPSPQA